VLAQVGSDDQVIVTFTRLARFVTPVNSFVEFFTSSAGGQCGYYAKVNNYTPYHIVAVSFRSLNSITDMRAMSQDTGVRLMGVDSVNAPILRPDENGNLHSGGANYSVTGTVNGRFRDCEAAVRDFVSNFTDYTFVTKCTMDGVSEGQCLSFVPVYVARDFIDQAIAVDNSSMWINTRNNNPLTIRW